jgi:hypothetical protein
MEYETLDDGTLLTDEAVDKLVTDVYTAIERGNYTVIANPHKSERSSAAAPLHLPPQLQAELLGALSINGN